LDSRSDFVSVFANQADQMNYGTIAGPDLNHDRRSTLHPHSFGKVLVLCKNCEMKCLSPLPNISVWSTQQVKVADMRRFGKQVPERVLQASWQIFID
jgi:hypothetical protein